MKTYAVLCLTVLLSCYAAGAQPQVLIDKSGISASGTVHNPQAGPGNTIDDDLATYWHGTDNIQVGMTDYLAYHFSRPYDIRRIDFWNNAGYHNYQLGELDIQVSTNSTDGLDGDWTTVQHIDGDFSPPEVNFSVETSTGDVTWVRLWMTYEGRGASGITPAFYLSEIDFYGIAEPPCGWIVFGAEREGDRDIYIMKPDGTSILNLTNTPDTWEYSPRWSRDGTKIAFSRSGGRGQTPDMWVMGADGSDQRNLTGTPDVWEEWPAWSPDSSKIAYSRSIGSEARIYVMNADGTDVTALTSGRRDAHPDWSPDGTKIVFDRAMTPDEPIGHGEIFVTNTDGTSLQQLTYTGVDDYMPSWSPDGSKIAFMSTRGGNYLREQIYVGDFVIDGSGTAQLLNQTNISNSSYRHGGPRWSPDGSDIVFHRAPYNTWNGDIWVMNADGANPVQLTNTPAVPEGGPDWVCRPPPCDFWDSFECYAVGTVPSPPWIRDYNRNSIVVDETAFSGTQSYKLRGAWNWSDTAHVNMTFPDTFTFEVACNVANGAAGAGQFQFHGSMVSDENTIWFGPDWNKIGWYDGTTVVPYCQENTWYKAVVTISGYHGPTPKASVTVHDVNGTQIGAQSDLPAHNVGGTAQQQFVLHTRSQPLNGQGAIAYFDDICIGTPSGPELVQVNVDLKPGSCPNPLNLDAKGVLPVAVLGSEEFDVSAIDLTSVRLAEVAPVRSRLEDVSTPVADGNECDCTEAGADGFVDLTLKFKTCEIVEALLNSEGELVDGGILKLALTGELFDATPIEGADCVVLVGQVPGWIQAKRADIDKDGGVNLGDLFELKKQWGKSAVSEE